MRRVGVLMSVADAPEGQARLAAFLVGLQQWGWTEGRNVRIDTRWGGGDAERTRKNVAELLALGPDVFLASGDHPVVELQHATRTAPIVFTMVGDPVGAGFVESLARPGGNITGFVFQQLELAQKQVELLNQAFPDRTRLAMLFDAQSADQFVAAERTAKLLNLQVQSLRLENPPYDFEAAIRGAASGDAQMLLILSSPFFLPYRARIVEGRMRTASLPCSSPGIGPSWAGS